LSIVAIEHAVEESKHQNNNQSCDHETHLPLLSNLTSTGDARGGVDETCNHDYKEELDENNGDFGEGFSKSTHCVNV